MIGAPKACIQFVNARPGPTSRCLGDGEGAHVAASVNLRVLQKQWGASGRLPQPHVKGKECNTESAASVVGTASDCVRGFGVRLRWL